MPQAYIVPPRGFLDAFAKTTLLITFIMTCMNMHLHIPVDSHLSEYITFVWELHGNQRLNETILPQGVVEMVFNLGDSMIGGLAGADLLKAPYCFIQGLNTARVEVAYHGEQHLFGIRLQPGMLRRLLGIIPAELKNTQIDLTLIKPLYNAVWHQLKEAASFEERVKIIQTVFPVLTTTPCPRIQKLCNLFMAEGIENFASPTSLSKQVYYSARHLNRKTQELFGVSAEELVIYKKFLHAVNLLHHSPQSLTSIAYESGFYDQAHFCRIFKSYAGITPKEYRLQKSGLPFHLFSKP